MSKCKMLACRYLTALVLFLYITLSYMIRVDINVTLLSMVNDTKDETLFQNQTSICGGNVSENVKQKHSVGTYEWNRPIQGLILGAFFWGYIIVQIPGGLLAHHCGPRWLGLGCILGSAAMDICLPSAASLGYTFLIVSRVIQGLFQGPMMPISAFLIGRWVPPNERSRFAAFVYAGTQIGTVLGQSVAGALAQTRELLDPHTRIPYYVSYWHYVHYLFGCLGLLFALLWFYSVYDEPAVHPRIHRVELDYLHACLGDETDPGSNERKSVRATSQSNTGTTDAECLKWDSSEQFEQQGARQPGSNGQAKQNAFSGSQKYPVPWHRILTSRPVWAVLLCHVTYNWSWYSLITCMPTYMSRVLGFDMFDNGLLSSIPYLVQCLIAQLVAQISDSLITRHLLSITCVRKVNNLIALGGVGIGLLAVGFIGCQRIGAVFLLATSIGLMGFASSGYSANVVDLAPKFAGNIISLTNTVATLPGIFGPLLVGYMTKDSSSIENWQIVFAISAGLAWFGAAVNLLLTSGELQPWAEPTKFEVLPAPSSFESEEK